MEYGSEWEPFKLLTPEQRARIDPDKAKTTYDEERWVAGCPWGQVAIGTLPSGPAFPSASYVCATLFKSHAADAALLKRRLERWMANWDRKLITPDMLREFLAQLDKE